MILLKCMIIFLSGAVLSKPTDDIQDVIEEAEMSHAAAATVMQIVPSGYSPRKLGTENKMELTHFLEDGNDAFRKFIDLVDKGYTKKGLTFNIYDDKMREAAIALFRLFKDLDEKTVYKIYGWAKQNINEDMLQYAWRLAALYGIKINQDEMEPPFIMKPNYFVNSETIQKAAKVKLSNGRFDPDVARVYQLFRTDDIIYINTNYSNWDSFDNPCDSELNYFREDVGLNSFYYGLHLLHPFWMSNQELDEINPRHAEHYYYAHQQLMARYLLEKEHIFKDGFESKMCDNIYNPYLVYDNGLPFPSRTPNKWEWSDGRTYLTAIDIAMRECISRGLIIMDNGSTINMTEENHTDLLAKLIRANLDGIKAAKIVRSLYGYGGNVPSTDNYNPSPSVLHHPETSLRDPIFWELIKTILNYFIDYKNSMSAYDLRHYENDEISIVNADIPNLTTYFSYYEFDIGKAIENDQFEYIKSPFLLAARQRRLTHVPFHFDFTLKSNKERDVAVRLFLGPKCKNLDCWDSYVKFFELDGFTQHLKEGSNNLTWSSKVSVRLSGDYSFTFGNAIKEDNKYSMFKFPESLLLPKGLESGLNMTLFVIITPLDDTIQDDIIPQGILYQNIVNELDNKPLGFPFHRPATYYNAAASNYKLYNITIYHNKSIPDESGLFAQSLY